MDNAIYVDHVSKVYKLYKKPQDRMKEAFSLCKKTYHTDFCALSDITFSAKKGETLAIIGKNGAGKSTLLKLITGVATPTSGTIQVDGQVSALLELGTGFNPEFNGYENIYLNGTMRGYSKKEMDEKLDEIISFADIGNYIEQPVKMYSSGMFARLAFSVMISFQPEILIVDEALSVGDIFFQQKCNTYMKEKMADVTKLLVTHDMNTVANMADRVILLDQGRVLQIGKPLEVIEEYLKMMHSETYGHHQENEPSLPREQSVTVDSKTTAGENWMDISPDCVAGAMDISIQKFSLFVNSEATDIVKPDDQVNIEVLIRSEKDCENLILGYTFKDKYGNSIFAQNTLGAGVAVEGIKKGGSYVLSWQFSWPQIREGDYFLTLGVGEGRDQMVHVIQCWAHNIAHLESISTIPMHGIFNHTMMNFEVRSI